VRSTLPFLLIALLWLSYPLAYAALRLDHFFVHSALFSSEEGLNPHYFHTIEGHEEGQRLFMPLIAAELWCWQHWKP
jgi:hypothetical protein